MQAKLYQAAQWIFGVIAAIAFLMLLGTVGSVDSGIEFPYWQVILILSAVIFLLCLLGFDCSIRAYNDCLLENIKNNERNETYVGFES